MVDLFDRLEALKARVASACDVACRDPLGVTLVAVTKTVSIQDIRAAYELGIRHFGENRLQEALPKIEALPSDITWHFIGKLQSNKVRRAAQSFTVIHTIETESQLRELANADRPIDVLVEVNIAEELQKSGILPSEVEDFTKKVLQCETAHFRGLMTIGPANQNPEALRPFFGSLRGLNEKVDGTWLSMGMSSDFDVAIQEGATHIRVGSALFGARS